MDSLVFSDAQQTVLSAAVYACSTSYNQYIRHHLNYLCVYILFVDFIRDKLYYWLYNNYTIAGVYGVYGIGVYHTVYHILSHLYKITRHFSFTFKWNTLYG